MKYHTVRAYEIIVPIKVERLGVCNYLATSPVLPGLVAEGRTVTEAMEIAQDVAKKLIESYIDHGDPLPASLQKQIKKKSKDSYLQIPIAVNF